MATPFSTKSETEQKIQEAYQELDGKIDGVSSGFRGTIVIADTPTEDGYYKPIEEGVYPNAGGLDYLPSTTDEGFDVTFINSDGTWVKNSIRLVRSPAKTALTTGFGFINFDIENGVIETDRPLSFISGKEKIQKTPEEQSIPLLNTFQEVIIYVEPSGEMKTAYSAALDSIPSAAMIIATYFRGSEFSINVEGLENYRINGITVNDTTLGNGLIVSTECEINEDTLSVGNSYIIYGRKRYAVSARNITLLESPSVLYYTPSTDTLATIASSSINSIPLGSIIFAGHYGKNDEGKYEIWGMNVRKSKRMKRKLLTDFDPTNNYYTSDTTLSMTDEDAEPLIGSDPNIMTNRYDSLMSDNNELITKEHLTDISTSLGDRPIDVFTFTPKGLDDIALGYQGNFKDYPHIFLNCALHGHEKTGSIAAYNFLEAILNDWQNSKVLEWFRFNVKISIIPTANPYGWVENTRQNSNNVDLNRNFPFQYKSEYKPNTSEYSGTSTLDQPESLAINTWLDANASKLILGIDVHNFFGTSASNPNLTWTEGVSKFTNQLGRINVQRISRGSRNSSPFLPSDYNELLGTTTYIYNCRGRLAGQINDKAYCGLTFEVHQNFRYDPNFKANDNNAIRLSSEILTNSVALMTWRCIEDFNSKNIEYKTFKIN